MYQRCDLRVDRRYSVPSSGCSQWRLAGDDLTLAWNVTCNLASNITNLLSTQQVARLKHRTALKQPLSLPQVTVISERAGDSALKRVSYGLITLDLLDLATSLKCRRKESLFFLCQDSNTMPSRVETICISCSQHLCFHLFFVFSCRPNAISENCSAAKKN